MNVKATDLFVWGFVAHMVVDWLLQNEWMALHKSSLRHPSAWVHGGLHLIGAWLVFPLWAALLLTATHLLIDTRVPLKWWRRTIGQTVEGPETLLFPLSLWQDQAAHIACLAAVALIVAHRR